MRRLRALALIAALAPTTLCGAASAQAPAAQPPAAETPRRVISTGQGQEVAAQPTTRVEPSGSLRPAPSASRPAAQASGPSHAEARIPAPVLPGDAAAQVGDPPPGADAGADAAMVEEAAAEPAPAPAPAAPAPITDAEIAEAMRGIEASNPAASETASAAAREQLRQWDALGARAAQSVADGKASTAALEVLRQDLSAQRDAAKSMAARTRAAGDPFRGLLEALGPAPAEGAAEPRETAIERKALNALMGGLDSRAKQADLAAARATGLIDDIDRLIRDRFAQQLQTRGPSPLDPETWPITVTALFEATAHLSDETFAALRDPVASAERDKALPLIGIAVVLALALGGWTRRRLISYLVSAAPEGAGLGRRVAVGAMVAMTRLLLPALALAIMVFGIRTAAVLGYRGDQALGHLARGLAVVIAAQAIARAYYAPAIARFRLSSLDDKAAGRAAGLSLGLGMVYFVDAALVGFGEEFGFPAEALSVVNAAVLVVGAVFMWGLAGYVRPDTAREEETKGPAEDDIAAYQPPSEDDEKIFLGRNLLILGALMMRLVAVGSVALAAAGYYAASRYAFFPTTLTLGLLAAGVLLFTMIREGVEGYISEGAASHAAARAGSDGGGLRLIPIFAGLVIILALIPELALIWGARTSDLIDAWAVIENGMMLGETRISPVDFLTFAVVFLGVYTVMRLLQSVLRRSVLPNTRLDMGARNAITSFAGYAGFALAALAAISAAGLDLSSLAIVAGALSVGIGFGLQNVVNNFVSGIILLVERPIKVGDWIEVNGTHGTVKKISVRATEIETFDRAAYIVPNGDLISSPVMNMTHGNNVGRLIIPVGVAYGADTEQVRQILEKVSTSHSAVLRYPAPQILFMEFGADSLNFEIRCILRDVGQVLTVRSHMHFEIDKRFREAGIEIPFAQRDIHLRNPGDLGEAIGKALTGALSGYAAARAPQPPASQPPATPPMPPMRPGEGRPDPAARPDRTPPETDPRPAHLRGEADADGDPGTDADGDPR